MLHIVLSFGCGEWMGAYVKIRNEKLCYHEKLGGISVKLKAQRKIDGKIIFYHEEQEGAKGAKRTAKTVFTMKDMKVLKLKDAIRKAFTTKDTKCSKGKIHFAFK